MANLPPLLPHEVLRRVLRIARLDGTSVLFIAGLFALLSAGDRDAWGTGIGILISAAGAMELHGVALLGLAQTRGLRWLIGSQLYFMAAVLSLVVILLNHGYMGYLNSLFPEELIRQAASQQGMSPVEFRHLLLSTACFALTVGTLVYQGGMTLYFLRRRRAILTALQAH